MKIRIILLSALLFLVFNSYSTAQVGLNLGTEYGVGVIAQVGSPEVKLEFGGGFTPILVYWAISGTYSKDYLKLYLSGTVGAKLNIAINNDQKHRLGLKLGLNYDSIIETGLGAGIDYKVSKTVVISGGAMYYPNAYDKLLDKLNDEENTNYTKEELSSVLIGFRPFISLSIYFGEE